MYRRLEPVSIELEGLGLTHLQSGDAGLRELAGTEQIDALRTFASAMEPVSFGERYKAQHTDQLTALDRFVDAVRPDPPSRHWFEMTVKRFLANPKGDTADSTALALWLTNLSDSVPTVRQQMLTSPRLADVSTRADQLLELTAMGHEALQYLSKDQKAPAGWKAKQMQTVEEVKKQGAMVRFTFSSAMSELVNAVAE